MILVVNYHYIRPAFNDPYPGIFGVTPQQFSNQLDALAGYGTFVSQDELVRRILGGEQPDPKKTEFMITFDDGLREQYELALPVLQRKGIPAVFYVNSANRKDNYFSLVHQIHLLRSRMAPADFMELLHHHEEARLSDAEKQKAVAHYIYDDPASACLKYILNFKFTHEEQEEIIEHNFPKVFPNALQLHDDLYMDLGQIRSLADLGYLGTHAHHHVPLGLLDSQGILEEIQTSVDWLESVTGSSIRGIAYPYGSLEACGGKVPALAASCGLVYGFSTERAAVESLEQPLLLPRYNCNDLPGGKSNLFKGPLPWDVHHREWFYN